MRGALALAILVACGGTPPAATRGTYAEPLHNAPAEPTCGEVGILLRGPNEDRSESSGPAKERAIAESCERDRWARPVIACVASSTHPTDCLRDLSKLQREAYDQRIAAWAVKYGEPPGATPDTAPTCFDALHAIELFDPTITDASPERDWELTTRQRVLSGLCSTDGWSDEQMACLRDASTEAATGTCVATLDPKVHARLVALHDLAKTIETLRKTPAKIECPKVAEHHYSDAKAQRDLKKLKPADRKTLLAGIRKSMSDACTSDAWDEPTRACMIADGGEETCIGTVHWAAVQPSGQMYTIPACADYAKAVSDFQLCDAAPRDTRTAMYQALQQMDQSTVAQASASQKTALETACVSAANMVRSVTASYGC
ncbi:MAG TPA: hypothetical protein VL326_11415 [Kofleriaceae bacterium]|nr:hypothetical protein [Kofleriaceae bacterium]